MSIEYYVEGKITTQTEGNQRNFSKGNIEHNSLRNVNQKGTDTGISLNTPDEIHDNDIPVNIIDVSLNLFFDGTQNNKTNTELGKDYKKSNHKDDSYTNDYSNVARGYDAINPNADNQVSWYIEGIGTEDSQSESLPFTTKPNNRGIPLGTGPRGVQAKVVRGCVKGAEALKNYAGREINLKVNVYGFSRGSAAARHFIHIASTPAQVFETTAGLKVLSPDEEYPLENVVIIPKKDSITDTNGYFGACLLFWNLIPKKIIFNFIGLYDTVASYGINHRGGYGIDNDTKQLHLDAISKAAFVLQIASNDEYRDNFDLTNINSSAVKGLEFTFPGVHSDIGGGYVSGDKEVADLFKKYGPSGLDSCNQFKEILVSEGWYHEDQLKINYTPRTSRYGELKGAGEYLLQGTRAPKNSYDKIPLNTMFYYSGEFNVQYDQTLLGRHEVTDPLLIKIKDQINRYANSCNNLRNDHVKTYNSNGSSGNYLQGIKEFDYLNFVDFEDLKTLRNQYLHWSASVTKFGLSPRVENVTTSRNRTRNIQAG